MSIVNDNEYQDEFQEILFDGSDTIKILDDNEDYMLIKIDYVSLIRYIKHWSYNRQINEEFVNELYDSIVENNKIVWTLTAIKERSNNNLYLIDGQHRFEAIKKRMTEDNNLQFNNNLYIKIYLVDNKENDSQYIIDLFNKINKNTPLGENDYPDNTIINIIQKMIIDPVLTRGIKTDEKRHTSHQPYIHKKTLNEILQKNKDIIKMMDVNLIINNLKIINNRLRLKPFEDIYLNDNAINRTKWESAKKIEFFLGLKECKTIYKIENIIRNIKTPEDLFHY
jgi:hypothetical protein